MYHSQCGQDRYINETFFKSYKNGIFLDIGAHDGVRGSNTCFFEKELNWTGICIEPIPAVFELLKKNRNCECICGCISDEHDVVRDFILFPNRSMLSGLIHKFDPKRKDFIKKLMTLTPYEIIKVNCYNLNRILDQAHLNHINLLSLDTEGGELEILKNLDFSKYHIDVITVEDNYHNHEFVTFLESKGFTFVTCLKQDRVFVNNLSKFKRK